MQHANFSDFCDMPELNGDNYKIWKEKRYVNIDYSIRKDEAPINEINTQDEIFFKNNGSTLTV